MRLYSFLQTSSPTCPQSFARVACGESSACPSETAQHWQDIGGIEGFSLEWMLDRARPPQEALQ